MTGYKDEPADLPQGSPYWFTQGQNDYWVVEERRTGETGCRGTLAPMFTRKAATAVSGALNDAFLRGVLLGWREAATEFLRTGHVDPDVPKKDGKALSKAD